MARIVTFRGGQVHNDRNNRPASVRARGTGREDVLVLLNNHKNDSGVKLPGAFSGHFRQGNFDDLVTAVQQGREVTITGTPTDALGTHEPIQVLVA